MVRLILILTLILSSCIEIDNRQYTVNELNGEYVGAFWRDNATSEIWLNISDGKFSGGSSATNFPAICSGSFTVKENVISFTNECFFTANFDWSLILSGEYEILEKGESIVLKSLKNKSDYYELTRKP